MHMEVNLFSAEIMFFVLRLQKQFLESLYISVNACIKPARSHLKNSIHTYPSVTRFSLSNNTLKHHNNISMTDMFICSRSEVKSVQELQILGQNQMKVGHIYTVGEKLTSCLCERLRSQLYNSDNAGHVCAARFFYIWHWNSAEPFSLMGRCSVSNRWMEILANSRLHRTVVSERQWDESTTFIISHSRRESWWLLTVAMFLWVNLADDAATDGDAIIVQTGKV